MAVGKIIDAEFGGRNADDRYCPACAERFPRLSALCPRCGGALTLWATHTAGARQRRKRSRLVGGSVALLVLALVLLGRLLGLFLC